jgi:uncharacterized protein (DUF488 family)
MDEVVYTVGHSTHELQEFVDMLNAHGIRQLVDVRTVPRSRHAPQFNSDALEHDLPSRGIEYEHVADLGGLRHSRRDSLNTGWHNANFRGYADYMQTESFESGLDTLLAVASEKTTVIMCAEALPWRCHRSLIGDALIARGFEVRDIFDAHHWRLEKLTDFAQVDGLRITYPAPLEEEASP